MLGTDLGPQGLLPMVCDMFVVMVRPLRDAKKTILPKLE